MHAAFKVNLSTILSLTIPRVPYATMVSQKRAQHQLVFFSYSSNKHSGLT